MWTLEDLDQPPPGWTEVVNNCKGNPAFPQGYQGVEYKNLARVEEPKPIEEKVELTDPKAVAEALGLNEKKKKEQEPVEIEEEVDLETLETGK